KFKKSEPVEFFPEEEKRKYAEKTLIRLPRTQSEIFESIITLVIIPFSFIIVGAQVSLLDYGPRALVGVAAPLLALIWALMRRSQAWNESFGRLGWLSALLAIVIAHLFGPE